MLSRINGINFRLILFLILLMFVLVPSVDFLQLRNPTVSGKFIIFLFLIEVAAMLTVLRFLATNKILSFSFIDMLFLVIIAYITFNRYYLHPIYGFSIRYYELLGLCSLYFILKSVGNKKFYYLLFVVIVIGANIQIIVGWLQLYGLMQPNNNNMKVTGSFFNSGPYTGYLAAVFPATLYMLKHSKTLRFCHIKNEKLSVVANQIIRYLLIFNIFGCISLVPALKSRAGYLSLMVSVIFIYSNEISSFLSYYLQNKRIKNVAFTILLISVIGFAYFLISFKKGSSVGRYMILKSASGMIINKPLIGFGFDRFRSDYMNYQALYFTDHPDSDKEEGTLAGNTVYLFNEPLQFLVENGVIGMVFIFLFVYYLIKYTWRIDHLTSIAQISLISIFIFSLFSYPAEILPIKLLCFLYLSILISYYKGPFIIKTSLRRWRQHIGGRIVQIGLAVLSFTIFYLVGIQTLKWKDAYIVWQRSYKESVNSQFAISRISYQSIYDTFEANGDFLTEYGQILYLTQNYQQGIEVLSRAKKYINNTVVETTLGNCQKAIKNYDNAEQSYLLATHMIPGSFYNKYLLFKLYRARGLHLLAIREAKEILDLKVKIPTELDRIIRGEANIFLRDSVKTMIAPTY